MRVMLSLTREPCDQETVPSIRHVSAISMSYKHGDELRVVTRRTDVDNEKEIWEAVASIFQRKDTSPCGWNIRNDIWPAVCANFVRLGIPCDRLQPICERWSKAMLCDLAITLNQSAYNLSPSCVDGVQFLLGTRYDVLDEQYRFEHLDDIESISRQEHEILHQVLQNYTRLMYDTD